MGASTAAPRKGPRARREEDSDEEVAPQRGAARQASSAPAPRKPKGVYAVVLYDFPGEDEDELPLREGQKVRVTRQHESGWWTGELNGEIGMFPANYVKLL